LAGHWDNWNARDICAEPVREFARQLLEARPEDGTDFDPTDGVNLQEAEIIALYFNPSLRVARQDAQVPLAGARKAGLWDDPQIELEVLRILNRGRGDRRRILPGEVSPTDDGTVEWTGPQVERVEGDRVDDPWVIGVGLSLTIPLSGRLAVEKDKAWAEYDAAWRHVVVQEWRLMRSLRQQWMEWSAVRARIDLVSTYLEQSTQVTTMAEQLAAAGELKPTDARVLEIEQAMRCAELADLVAEAENRRLGLLAMMGLVPEASCELVPCLMATSDEAQPEQARELLLHNYPPLLFVQSEYEVAEQQLRLEIREQYPDISIGPSYAFEESQSRLGFGFGMPIPLWNRNQRGIAEVLAARDAARARAEAVCEEAVAKLAEVEARLEAALQRRRILEQDVAPLVDRQIEETRQLAELGEIDALLLRDALAQSLETKLALLSATLDASVGADELRSMLWPRWLTPEQRDTNGR
jgi:outer membrane protein TolC